MDHLFAESQEIGMGGGQGYQEEISVDTTVSTLQTNS
jgi:hypothetical protein